MSREVKIRSAQIGDRVAVLGVVREAFATGGRDGQEEVDIVEAVWNLDAVGQDLELVATIEEAVVGYVLGSWGHLGDHRVIGVAPLAVAPAFQLIGVGSTLMRALTARADADRLPLLVLLGDPGYYRRFGFEAASPLGIVYPPMEPGNPHFQVRRRTGSTPASGGGYTYAWEGRHRSSTNEP